MAACLLAQAAPGGRTLEAAACHGRLPQMPAHACGFTGKDCIARTCLCPCPLFVPRSGSRARSSSASGLAAAALDGTAQACAGAQVSAPECMQRMFARPRSLWECPTARAPLCPSTPPIPPPTGLLSPDLCVCVCVCVRKILC